MPTCLMMKVRVDCRDSFFYTHTHLISLHLTHYYSSYVLAEKEKWSTLTLSFSIHSSVSLYFIKWERTREVVAGFPFFVSVAIWLDCRNSQETVNVTVWLLLIHFSCVCVCVSYMIIIFSLSVFLLSTPRQSILYSWKGLQFVRVVVCVPKE